MQHRAFSGSERKAVYDKKNSYKIYGRNRVTNRGTITQTLVQNIFKSNHLLQAKWPIDKEKQTNRNRQEHKHTQNNKGTLLQ